AGYHAIPADETVSRPQADDTTKRRRTANRAAGVGAERARHEPRRDGRSRTTARAAGEMLGIPWVARWGPGQIESRAAMREFMGSKLSEQYCARLIQPGDCRSVFVRNIIDADFRVPGSQYSRGVVEIFQTERYSV